ncbi:esterase-like activity of phytase family protein [Ferrimonas balearica]|uniref:esterase-like activity of phytase family protein n=1 Tax=Ferrimonas balearica TaxID=44012 RepID=UPI001C995CCF|nr:esterase-like activity of phytase family protein [Ferrimonas balearica]MBY5991510.1 esterase-like activity of phytase family protein [Ferrimonas balearica]
MSLVLLLAATLTAAPAPTLPFEPWPAAEQARALDGWPESLRYAGTLWVKPPTGLNTHQGGWSTLQHLGGLRFQSFSDRHGHWLSFDLRLTDAAGAQGGAELSAVDYHAHGQLLGSEGEPVEDVESIAQIGELLLAGRDGEPWLYQLDRRRQVAVPRLELPGYRPKANDGVEALVFVHGFGPLLAVSEKTRPQGLGKDHRQAWLWHPDREPVPLALPLPQPYPPVDATRLPDDSVILLHRHFHQGTTTIGLSRYPGGPEAWSNPKRPPLGEALLTLRSDWLTPGALDNFEGIAAFTHEDRTYLLLIADNNFDWQIPGMQRTLLMLLEWTK